MRTFPGSTNTDRVVVSSYSTMSNLTTQTVSLWAYLNGVDATSRRLYDKTNGVAGQGAFESEVSTYLGGMWYWSYSRWGTQNGGWYCGQPSTGVWHHFLVTYDASSTANDPVMYLDGSSQSVTELYTPSGTLGTESAELDLGNASTQSWLRCLNGSLGEFAVWDRILTADEIAALKNKFAASWFARGLVCYLPLIGSSTEPNLAPNATSGTVTATTIAAHLPIIYPTRPLNLFTKRGGVNTHNKRRSAAFAGLPG